MKLNEQQIDRMSRDNPHQPFDICSKCGDVQLFQTMKEVNEVEFDLVCNDCIDLGGKK